MKKTPQEIFSEYNEGVSFKNSLGAKGLYEQSKINERFFIGDQWYGAKCGNDRPLVRHNIIKRIGEYKMSQVLSAPISVRFSADGIPESGAVTGSIRSYKEKMSANPEFKFEGNPDTAEINAVFSALSSYRNVTAERVGFESLCHRALKKAYISGSSVLYTYWDSSLHTAINSKGDISPNGDICCEVLDIENVYFADPYLEDIQSQPYIIIASLRDINSVRREARAYGFLGDVGIPDADGKILVLTKLYKEYKDNGEVSVHCIKVTEKAFIRQSFDTLLSLYPLSVFRWDERQNMAYGESEVTYLIPNQIAINRMITANVWAAMTMGMPLMVVNGDTVTDEVTNDPGQIIRIYGTNEDVSGAVKYVTPPDFCTSFGDNINNLIENTLTQSGANTVVLGDSRPDNAAALASMRDAATMPMRLIKQRYYSFIEQISRIWADFWFKYYNNRKIRIEDENGIWYLPFDASRYSNLYLTARVDVGADNEYSVNESIAMLGTLLENGIITKKQYLKRLPSGIVPDIDGLIIECEESSDDGI